MTPRWLDRLIDSVVRTCAVLAAGGAAVLALIVSYGVIQRALVGQSVPGLVEFSETLMVLVVFFSMAYAESSETHVRMTLVTGRVKPRTATWFRLMAMIVSGAVVAAFAWQTGIAGWESYLRGEVRFGLLQFPVWPARWLIALGFFTAFLVYAIKIIDYVLRLKDGNYTRKPALGE